MSVWDPAARLNSHCPLELGRRQTGGFAPCSLRLPLARSTAPIDEYRYGSQAGDEGVLRSPTDPLVLRPRWDAGTSPGTSCLGASSESRVPLCVERPGAGALQVNGHELLARR